MKQLRYVALRGLLLVAVGFAGALVSTAGEADPRQAAIDLYATGRYAEAGKALEAIDRAGKADGTLLYRLAYCQRETGNTELSRKTQERAKTALEEQLGKKRDLETAFYLANTYENLGLAAQRAQLALDTTQALERGELTAENGVDRFRVGKLYADQGQTERATEWYERSIDDSDENVTGSSYRLWAGGYLADRAFERSDFEAAVKYMKILTAGEDGTAGDLDRLAVALARVGDYSAAATAWERAGKLTPADANRAQYCARLCEIAEKLGGLPDVTPAGGPWGGLTKENLETLMSEQAEIAKQVLGEAHQAESLSDEQRTAYRDRLQTIQGVFTATALEYALRGHTIRETSFFGGYAPLIRSRSAWRLPPRKPTAGTPEAAD